MSLLVTSVMHICCSTSLLQSTFCEASPSRYHTTFCVMQLMEMILGALGRDAIGLGAGVVHPRDSDEWKNMSLHRK